MRRDRGVLPVVISPVGMCATIAAFGTGVISVTGDLAARSWAVAWSRKPVVSIVAATAPEELVYLRVKSSVVAMPA